MSVANHTVVRSGARENRRCQRRVRQEACDALAVVAFSAAASTVLALAFTLIITLVG